MVQSLALPLEEAQYSQTVSQIWFWRWEDQVLHPTQPLEGMVGSLLLALEQLRLMVVMVLMRPPEMLVVVAHQLELAITEHPHQIRMEPQLQPEVEMVEMVLLQTTKAVALAYCLAVAAVDLSVKMVALLVAMVQQVKSFSSGLAPVLIFPAFLLLLQPLVSTVMPRSLLVRTH
jgi:hypothetical protein